MPSPGLSFVLSSFHLILTAPPTVLFPHSSRLKCSKHVSIRLCHALAFIKGFQETSVGPYHLGVRRKEVLFSGKIFP